MSNSKQKPKGNNEAGEELNEDGLVPGQQVDFYELLRIKSEQRNKEAE
jgi:hypothetical protein